MRSSESEHTSQRIVSSATQRDPFAFGSAQFEFGRNLAVVATTPRHRMRTGRSRCWVMHIVGDMHQPLHTAMWMSWRFPITDAGGQWAWSDPRRVPSPSACTGSGMRRAIRPRSTSRRRDRLEAKLEPDPPAETLSPDPETAFARWVAHTRELAYEVAACRAGG